MEGGWWKEIRYIFSLNTNLLLHLILFYIGFWTWEKCTFKRINIFLFFSFSSTRFDNMQPALILYLQTTRAHQYSQHVRKTCFQHHRASLRFSGDEYLFDIHALYIIGIRNERQHHTCMYYTGFSLECDVVFVDVSDVAPRTSWRIIPSAH